MILARRLRVKLLPYILKWLWLRRARRADLVRLGSDYGGWWVPKDSLTPGSVAFCAGAGEDITFDLQLLDCGLRVYVFDPTPRSIAHVAAAAPNSDRFTFVSSGWWSEATSLRFYAPQNPEHVSHSVANLQRTSDYFEADVDTVRHFAERFNIDEIGIAKLDIEGAEFAVLDSLVATGPLPGTICVEFDQPCALRRIVEQRRKLACAGYRLVHIEHWNFTFVRRAGFGEGSSSPGVSH